MQAYTYVEKGLLEKPKPVLLHERDAIVKVTLASICSSDLHIKHGSVPRAVPGITVGHEMVGVVESVGSAVTVSVFCLLRKETTALAPASVWMTVRVFWPALPLTGTLFRVQPSTS